MSSREIPSLNSLQVYKLAKAVADKYGLRKPDYAVLRKEMFGKFPQPVILDNDNGRLWVDRYYVAYQLDGCAEVKYVYVTRHHILEEKSDYRASAKRGNTKHTMPKEIAHQFGIISKKMLASGTEIWVDPNEDLQMVNTGKAV